MKFDTTVMEPLREKRGMTRMELAAAAGVHVNTISLIATGKMDNPTAATIAGLAVALDVSPAVFFVENGGAP